MLWGNIPLCRDGLEGMEQAQLGQDSAEADAINRVPTGA